MSPDAFDAASIEHDDAIGLANGREAVRDDKPDAPRAQPADGIDHEPFRDGIESSGSEVGKP